jgi:hypothetical protein
MLSEDLKTQITRDKHFLVPGFKLGNCQVCSSGTIEEALEWMRRTNPSGTQNNWQIDPRLEVAPGPCADVKGRTHYVFAC